MTEAIDDSCASDEEQPSGDINGFWCVIANVKHERLRPTGDDSGGEVVTQVIKAFPPGTEGLCLEILDLARITCGCHREKLLRALDKDCRAALLFGEFPSKV